MKHGFLLACIGATFIVVCLMALGVGIHAVSCVPSTAHQIDHKLIIPEDFYDLQRRVEALEKGE